MSPTRLIINMQQILVNFSGNIDDLKEAVSFADEISNFTISKASMSKVNLAKRMLLTMIKNGKAPEDNIIKVINHLEDAKSLMY